MAANQTTNYQLNQWEATDQVLRTDFNADNAKVDAALAGLAGAVLHIATGVYVGNGESSRAFSVPFPPKAVFLCTQSGQTYGESGIGHVYGGLAMADHPLQHETVNALVITDSGFTVYDCIINNLSSIQLNKEQTTYHYIAIG